MRKGRRSVERLFYWGPRVVSARGRVAGGAPATTAGEGAGATVMDAALKFFIVAVVGGLCAVQVWAQGPALTTISDIVYRGDGTAAKGANLILGPTFQTA